MSGLMTPAEMRATAQECEDKARVGRTGEIAVYLDLGRQWRHLADQLERIRALDIGRPF
jgi:hypothetical protein